MTETQQLVEALGISFWRGLYTGLQGLYNRLPELSSSCPDLVSKDYACQIRGYEAQGLLWKTASDCGYTSCGVPNRPSSANHVEALVNDILVTIQFSRRKYELGIPANYREDYARGVQLELPLCDRPKSLASHANRYLLVIHGAMDRNPFELGFLQAGMPHESLKRFLEPAVNIDTFFTQAQPTPEVVPIPQPQIVQIRR